MAKLKPRARIIRTIGDRLISGPEAAIIELVKNAYDADSPSVNIVFTPPLHEQENDIDSRIIQEGKIVISDQGHGMTKHDLENIWLEPATDEKKRKKVSKSGKRSVLGAKGVGRFATASLGRELTLTSISAIGKSLAKCRLSLNWDIFESAKYLEEINIEIQTLPVEDGDSTGVSIEVTGLNDIWGENKFRSLIQELRRLATPHDNNADPFSILIDLSEYKVSNEKKRYLEKLKTIKNRKELPHQKFSPYNFDGVNLINSCNKTLESMISNEDDNLVTEEDIYAIRINPYSLGDHCHYRVEGSFNKEGEFEGLFNIVRGDNVTQNVHIKPPELKVGEHSCGELKVVLRIFDLEADSVRSLMGAMGLDPYKYSLKESREIITESTGVGIFRNEFRIRPYGHHAHDWLKLEKRRVQQPSIRIGHTQVSGEIHVQSEWASMLVERSSREGLEENGAFFRLKSLITNLLLHVEAERYTFREKAGISRKPKKNFKQAMEIASLDKVKKAVESVHALSPEDRAKIELEVDKTSQTLEKVLIGMSEYLQLLESRATLGNLVAEVLHEGRGYLSSIAGTRDFLREFGPSLVEDSSLGEIARGDLPGEIENLNDGHTGISKLFGDLDPISGRKRGHPSYFKVLEVAEKVERLTKSTRNEAEVFIKYDVDKELTFFGFEGDLQAALMNLVLNATHWLNTVESEERYISISASRSDEFVRILIQNNGPEINEVHYDKLFEPGFTLKSKGHGLGLSIAKEAIINSSGFMSYDKDNELTTFEIRLPLKEND